MKQLCPKCLSAENLEDADSPYRECQECNARFATHTHWDERFLALAETVASWSKDPSTKTGAILVRPDRTVAALGYNGFPRGMRDDPAIYADREQKYDRVVHCEMNALLSCRDPIPLDGYSLYTLGPCCSRCVVHMIQVGIRRFVFTNDSRDRWDSWRVDRTFAYFNEVFAETVILGR